MIWNVFGKKKKEYLILNINGRLQPMDRGGIYEDPIIEVMEKEGIANVDGGGTLMSENGEFENCDIE